MNEDFLDLLAAFREAEVRFLVVGAHALALHGRPRATGDLDLLIEPSEENARRVWRALLVFGAPVEATGLTEADLAKPDLIYQIGQPPRRIDLLTEISGVDFTTAWAGRVLSVIGDQEVPFLGREAFVRNKRASGRAKDLADVEGWEG
jgi:hypothetical protein